MIVRYEDDGVLELRMQRDEEVNSTYTFKYKNYGRYKATVLAIGGKFYYLGHD